MLISAMKRSLNSSSSLRSSQYRVALRELPNRTCDRVAACPHLVVNLDWRKLPADPVVRTANSEPGLRQRALVSSHAGRRLFKEKKSNEMKLECMKLLMNLALQMTKNNYLH